MIKKTARVATFILCFLLVVALMVLFVNPMNKMFTFPAPTMNMNTTFTSSAPTMNSHNASKAFFDQHNNTSHRIDGWRPIGHTYNEQIRLRDMSAMIAAWPEASEDNIPTVPCLSADGHFLVLSVGASRVRYGLGLTFIMVYPTDVKTVLPKNILSDPLSSLAQSLWCIFNDGSVTPAYSYDSGYGNDRVSLLDCSLSLYASDQLWKYNKTLRVYLASTNDQTKNVPILKAFVNVPKSVVNSPNTSYELLTLCTSPLHNKANFLTQWVEFHRLVGFRKFVIYNATDNGGQLMSVLDVYARKYPNLIDVVQWNFSSLGLVDALGDRYFQTEALHDCLIRYGDQADWLGMLDLDEYVVPLHPYETVVDYLHENFGRRIVGSINLWSRFYCTEILNKYTGEENDRNLLNIVRFTFRASRLYKQGREKYLYRPRYVQYLSIHHQIVGVSKQQPAEDHIVLAHYIAMSSVRTMPGCNSNEHIKDTGLRDRFADRVKKAISTLAT